MNWIIDQIAIGNYRDAEAPPSDIDAVLCLREGCCDEGRTDIDVLCIPLIDGPGNDPRRVQQAIGFIADVVDAGDNVLVHCHAGRSRSVVIVARYLMERQGMTASGALASIAAKRAICLSDGIEALLRL